MTAWRGRLRRHDSSAYVHGAQRLWNVSEAVARGILDLHFQVPRSFMERLLIDITIFSLRQVLVQGRAIAVLVSEVGPSEVAYTNLRTMYEHYMDLRYLLLGDTLEQQRRALRVHLYARWDVMRHVPTIGGQAPQAARLKAELDEWLRIDGELAAIVEAEWARKRPPRHWSGLSRMAAFRAVNPDPKGNLNDYKFLSWMAHPFTAAVIGGIRGSPTHADFTDAFDDNDTARTSCRKATRIVLKSWRLVSGQIWFPPLGEHRVRR